MLIPFSFFFFVYRILFLFSLIYHLRLFQSNRVSFFSLIAKLFERHKNILERALNVIKWIDLIYILFWFFYTFWFFATHHTYIHIYNEHYSNTWNDYDGLMKTWLFFYFLICVDHGTCASTHDETLLVTRSISAITSWK